MKRHIATFLILASLLLAAQARASTWCGENGLIRFSFVEGDSLVTVHESGEETGGVTRLKVYCWLDEIEALSRDGEAFLHIGGYELALDIQGAESFIVGQEIPGQHLDMGKVSGQIAVGLWPGLQIVDGKVLLATWEVMFQGRPSNVRFGLDAAGGVHSAATLEGAPAEGIKSLYVGSESSLQMFDMFSAGYEPAWLNPTDEPDQEPVRGPESWQDVGVFEAR